MTSHPTDRRLLFTLAFTDYRDRSTCILFGDGTGAWVVSRSQSSESKGILFSSLHTDGEHLERL
ncbi:hypothetical protein [Effusibacillus consociatus]|uniref:Beta-ketoacyl-[acyl-carrier-protein] synthase III N-terminal domain-containing protein n=1 Tax=Effusibacillus consociatus TaxID=1117041 RepID=A0ABV9Q7I4_9BACL